MQTDHSMKYLFFQPVRFALLAGLLLFTGVQSAQAQVRTSWFDINPSNSNLDPSDPNGASGGRIHHLGATNDLSLIFAASEWGGLYQSFNQGLTWVRINTFAPTATWDVKFQPGSNTRVYATSFFDGRANATSGINISNNAGATWTTAPGPPVVRVFYCRSGNARAEPSAWQIAVHPSAPRTVFVGTNCGLARSVDGGINWNYVDPSPGDFAEQVYAVITPGNQIVDVITDNGHFHSTDNGVTWTPVPAVGNPGPVSGNSGPGSSLAASPRENYVLFASNGTNIWESDDAGATWPTSLTLPLRSGGASNVQGRIPFVKTNQLSSSTQFDVWYGDIDIFKTTATTPSTLAPGGAARAPLNNWQNVQNGAHNDLGDVLFDPRFGSGACPTCLATDGGIFRNTSNNNPSCQTPSWEQPAGTPHATWIWGFDGVQVSAGVHALTYGLQDAGGWATTDAREGFNNVVPNWNNYACCDVSDNAAQSGSFLSVEGFFSPGRGFRLFRRNADGGGSSEIPNYPSTGNINSFISNKEVVRFGNNAYAVAMSDGLFITNDITAGTISWTSLGAPTVPAGATSGVGGIKVATVGDNTNFYYFTGSGNPDGAPGLVFRRTANGAWTQLQLPRNINSISVYDVDPNNGNRLTISGINAVTNQFSFHRTTDFGVSWTAIPALDNLMTGGTFVNRSNIGPTAFTGFSGYWQPFMVQYNPRDPTTLIAGAADAGIFLSLDDGASWQLISRPTNPNSTSPHIPRPVAAYFSPGRFAGSTSSFDVWIATRGAGVVKAVIER